MLHCKKQNKKKNKKNRHIFYSMFQWFMKKDHAFETVRYFKKIRENQRKKRKDRER